MLCPRFCGGKVVPQAPKGGKRPKAANHRHAIPPDESKGIQPEPAGSMKLEADCLHLCPQRLLPAYWYLGAFLTLTALTEILRLRLRMTMRAGRQYRNAGSFLRKELGEALRIGLNLFSERPDAPILRRLRRHLLPKEGGYGTSSCGTGDTNVNSVTLTSYSSPRSGDTFPSEPFEPSAPSDLYPSAICFSSSLSVIWIFFPFRLMRFVSSSRWSLRERVSGVVPR